MQREDIERLEREMNELREDGKRITIGYDRDEKGVYRFISDGLGYVERVYVVKYNKYTN